MSDSEFKPWDRVRYIPFHAKGDPTHPDCQNGVVHHVEDGNIFVRYIENDLINTTAHSTWAELLIHW